jgi:thiol-disulfide isomerase/thioredoxin
MRLFILFLFLSNICYCQNNSINNHFKIKGIIAGKDTGKIAINYNDANNKGVFDTTDIINGKFEFTGTVNVVSDANLWTDIKNKNFSDRSVIRFLLEAENISIICSGDQAPKAIIKGSKIQVEWEDWEKEKSRFIISRTQYKKKADSIYILSKTDSSQYSNLRKLINQFDSVNITTRIADLNYITKHSNSYLSGFILSRYKRELLLDSVQKYYESLSAEVKTSNVGYTVLDYVYPLSDNISFKKANPLNGIEFNEKLALVKSIHDLTSIDVFGNRIDFKNFKGYYLLIDFWASWCKPCIADIPDLKKIIAAFKNDSIKFISVSLDTDEKKWKRAVAANKLNWLQVSDLKGFHGLVPTYCKIVIGIPQYILVDKNGEIINSNAPRPEDPDLKKMINNLIKKT